MTTMKASVKGRYEIDKVGAAGSVVFNAGDVKLRASMTDATGPSLNGLSLSLEKPGSFVIDYDVPKQDVMFQFMNTVRIWDKPLNLTYTHGRGENWTAVDGTLVFDSANKLSADYAFDSRNCKVKYSYAHRGKSTFEPSYDFAKNSWDFAMSRLCGDDIVRASYRTSTKVLGMEWHKNSAFNGTFKICASLNLAEKSKVPKLSAESTWNFDM
ncbi:outer envelope pore protein 24B, chloroplastic-like [Actinidia eriantha]|uniref:outer envelope pore protein 24B, chloroplastic-like n=1 Tax=Actinidia eriantha TaxID=165200 RepID=UPI002590273F|nr:outer envelope pore protein 24B, chloroplastic-like [Actinidia eriantha]